MKIEITDPNEIHLILLEKYQKSTANIVVRIKIDSCPTSAQLENAASKMVEKHPYLNARYFVEAREGKHKYFYEEISERQYKIESNDTIGSGLSDVMNSLSKMRTYIFSMEQGELFKLIIYKSKVSSIIELTIAHIIGEVPSALILAGDYLRYLDKSIAGLNSEISKQEKYCFSNQDFGWPELDLQEIEITDTKDHSVYVDPWQMPAAKLGRYKLSSDTYLELKNWLDRNNINAKVSDVFYFIADKLLEEMLNKAPEFWLIMGYRNLAKKQELKKAIFNFAFFSPVVSEQFNSSDIKTWLEGFYQYRSHMITAEGVNMSRSFFHSLNKSMEGTSLQKGKRVMDSVVKFPDFAFNNFGSIDRYMGSHSYFNILDIDVQDGTPAQEIRYFSFKDELYVNPTFFINNGIEPDIFWGEFLQEISRFTNNSKIASANSSHITSEPVF